jgi:hypothetical protein
MLFRDFHFARPVDDYVISMITQPKLKDRMDKFVVWFKENYFDQFSKDTRDIEHKIVFKYNKFILEFEKAITKHNNLLLDSPNDMVLCDLFIWINNKWYEYAATCLDA